MDNKALKLASLFAYSPNSHGYCGLESASAAFSKCIKHGSCNTVAKELKSFITLYPYLKTISRIRKLQFYDYKVIEAYWIGNELLKDFPISGYQMLIREFEKQGVPKWLTKDLSKRYPKKFIPHHLFQVLHVGVGQASGSVPFNIKSINDCMIRFGDVKSLQKDYLVASINGLQKNGSKYELKKGDVKIHINDALFLKPKIHSRICIHWGHIVKKFTIKEEKNIRFWSNEVLKSLL